jgi:hypothetical protein
VRLLGGDGSVIEEAGQKGDIVTPGPNVMLGYWNRPAETAEGYKLPTMLEIVPALPRNATARSSSSSCATSCSSDVERRRRPH